MTELRQLWKAGWILIEIKSVIYFNYQYCDDAVVKFLRRKSLLSGKSDGILIKFKVTND